MSHVDPLIPLLLEHSSEIMLHMTGLTQTTKQQNFRLSKQEAFQDYKGNITHLFLLSRKKTLSKKKTFHDPDRKKENF